MIKSRVRRGLILMVILLLVWILMPQTPIKIGIPKPHIQRTKATYEEKLRSKALALRYADVGYGWKGREGKCLVTLWTRESRFDHLSDNDHSTAYGIAQVLGETSSEPAIQILRGLRYIGYRYKTPCRALRFHVRHNWY
jgi:hypothetical protein